jgi:hypothetical protein
MSTVGVRLPTSIQNRIKVLSKEEKVSNNQFITTALAEKCNASAPFLVVQISDRNNDLVGFAEFRNERSRIFFTGRHAISFQKSLRGEPQKENAACP